MNWDMTWNTLGRPRPLPEGSPYIEHAWSSQPPLALPACVASPMTLSALTTRRSRRSFCTLAQDQLAVLLWSVAGSRESVEGPLGYPLEHRSAPSAGAIHPIHILVCDPATRILQRYDGLSHTLQHLDVLAPEALLAACEAIIPLQAGTLLFFVAEPGKTAAKYADPVSLVLRDAGIQQGILALAAEALELNFCLLGATGDPWLAELSHEGKLRGVGAALVGARA